MRTSQTVSQIHCPLSIYNLNVMDGDIHSIDTSIIEVREKFFKKLVSFWIGAPDTPGTPDTSSHPILLKEGALRLTLILEKKKDSWNFFNTLFKKMKTLLILPLLLMASNALPTGQFTLRSLMVCLRSNKVRSNSSNFSKEKKVLLLSTTSVGKLFAISFLFNWSISCVWGV